MAVGNALEDAHPTCPHLLRLSSSFMRPTASVRLSASRCYCREGDLEPSHRGTGRLEEGGARLEEGGTRPEEVEVATKLEIREHTATAVVSKSRSRSRARGAGPPARRPKVRSNSRAGPSSSDPDEPEPPKRRPLETRYEWRRWSRERRAPLERLDDGVGQLNLDLEAVA
jgi:hypothetical protein